jgi:hypothetical protein
MILSVAFFMGMLSVVMLSVVMTSVLLLSVMVQSVQTFIEYEYRYVESCSTECLIFIHMLSNVRLSVVAPTTSLHFLLLAGIISSTKLQFSKVIQTPWLKV